MNGVPKVITRGLVAVALALPAAGFAAASPAQAATTPTYASYEYNVVKAINKQRTSRGLRALSYTACPDRYAEALATRLRYSSTLWHQSLGPILSGCDATRASENIVRASGNTEETALVRLWMNSSGHRANILDSRVTQIGVGTTCTSAKVCTTVADFIRR